MDVHVNHLYSSTSYFPSTVILFSTSEILLSSLSSSISCLLLFTYQLLFILQAGLQDEERTVLQFHYTTWPDKNVPAQASPVLDFLRAINSANDCPEYGPIVVHCRLVVFVLCVRFHTKWE